MKRVTVLVALAVALTLLGGGCTGSLPTDTRGTPRSTPETTSATPSPDAGTPAPTPPQRQIVWVSVEDDQRVVAVDVRGRKVIRRFRVSGVPHNVTVAADGTVVVALQGSGRIALIRGGRSREVELGGSPHDVKVFGGTAVVANEGQARVDLVALSGKRVAEVPLKANPHDVALTATGRAWLTLDGSDELALVDVQHRRVGRYVPTGRRPHDLLVAPDERLWVTDWEGGLHVFSRRGRLLRTIPVGVEAHHLAFTPGPGRREVWLTDHEAHRVFVIDARSLRVVDELHIDGAPHHVAITPDGRWAVVADHDGGTLLVYRARGRRLVARIAVGDGPHGVWAEPAP
jgi:DNA-binding beta-propeller fold protein YncE